MFRDDVAKTLHIYDTNAPKLHPRLEFHLSGLPVRHKAVHRLSVPSCFPLQLRFTAWRVHIKLRGSRTKRLECQPAALSGVIRETVDRKWGLCFHDHSSPGMKRCFPLSLCCRFTTGPQNNQSVQRHPGLPDGGRGGGVHGGPDHVHKEPGTRSGLMQD